MKLTQKEKLIIIRRRLYCLITDENCTTLDEETIELAIDLINTTNDKEFKKQIKAIT